MSLRLNFCRSVPPEFLRSFFQNKLKCCNGWLILMQRPIESSLVFGNVQNSKFSPASHCNVTGLALQNYFTVQISDTLWVHWCTFQGISATEQCSAEKVNTKLQFTAHWQHAVQYSLRLGLHHQLLESFSGRSPNLPLTGHVHHLGQICVTKYHPTGCIYTFLKSQLVSDRRAGKMKLENEIRESLRRFVQNLNFSWCSGHPLPPPPKSPRTSTFFCQLGTFQGSGPLVCQVGTCFWLVHTPFGLVFYFLEMISNLSEAATSVPFDIERHFLHRLQLS